jgi:CDP-4-dehydro-6-deoxyglucose reductase, E1
MEPVRKVWYAPNKFEAYGEEEIKAVEECLRDGWLAGFGPRSIEFEEKISKYFGKKLGVFVNSGSSACLLAIAGLNLPKGCKIITPACTFSTTLAPIIQLGYKPLFCDVNLTSYVPDVLDVVKLIDSEVKAIMIPNLIGNKPDWKLLKEELKRIGREDIFLIEDSADTMTYTQETDVSTTSFYASHVITAGGQGGMVMFNDEKHKLRALSYRDWGRMGDDSEIMDDRFNHKVDGIPYDHKFLYSVLGYNMKCSEMNAAFGLVQLERFQKFEKIRRENIERYLENLKDVKEIILPNDSIKPNWLAIPLQCNCRLDLLTYLENQNIQTRVTFAGNVTRHPIYREYLQEFTNSDTIMENGFLLGAHHGMNIEDVDYVCDKIKEFFNKKK